MSRKLELEQLVIDHVIRPEYQPVKPKVIVKQLGLPQEEAGLLRKAVKRFLAAAIRIWLCIAGNQRSAAFATG